MSIPEILSPVGSLPSLYAAVNNGCDAVYLGGKDFNARHNADNFSIDDIILAIDYCHLRQVKVYITVNTLYKNNELAPLFAFLSKLYEAGADAFILQDIGASALIKKTFPNIKLHSSTQMTVHDVSGVLFMEKNGFDRVVLSRELSLEQITEISAKTSLETEVFVHGALCFCYSGQCLMSSVIGGRSGNRGKCAQPCRLKYDFYDDDKLIKNGYLLSPADLMSLDVLPEIVKSGVTSLKIEGRMKSPEYVAISTKNYRKHLDESENKDYKINEESFKPLSQVFNRGGSFTEGYFHNYSHISIMSNQTSKSLGSYVGEVDSYNVNTDKCVIFIKDDLYPGDGIEVFTATEPHAGTNINEKYISGSKVTLKVIGKIKKGDKVYKSYDKPLMDNLKALAQSKTRKTPINAKVTAIAGKELLFEIWHNDLRVSQSGKTVEVAQKQPLTAEKLLSQLSKTGDTPFFITFDHDNCTIDDQIYIGISDINECRRQAMETFTSMFISSYKRVKPDLSIPKDLQPVYSGNKKITVQIHEPAQFSGALLGSIHRIYVEATNPFLSNIDDYAAKAQNMGIELFVALPKISGANEDALVEKLEKSGIDGYLIRTWGQLDLLETTKKNKALDYSFNVTNSLSAQYLQAQSHSLCLSVELNFGEINGICGDNNEIIIHGKQPLMVTKQCPVGIYAGEKGNDKYCKLKGTNSAYYLKDRKSQCFPVKTNCDSCIAFIYNSQLLFTLDKIQDVSRSNPEYMRLVFLDETPEEITRVLSAYIKALDSGLNKQDAQNEQIITDYVAKGITNGHFYRGVL